MYLVEEVYNFMKVIPGEEKFGLIAQMKRSSVSIPLKQQNKKDT